MGARLRAHDWVNTPLGEPQHWPRSLKTAVRIMLTSRQPIWIGWGGELTYLYNDAYKSIIGGKHPWALGRSTAEVWREIWHEIGPMLATAMKGDEGTYVEEQLLIMERSGYREETYYTFSYSPIPDDEGKAEGIICANTDDTRRVIGERQLALLRELAAAAADVRTLEGACLPSCRAGAGERSEGSALRNDLFGRARWPNHIPRGVYRFWRGSPRGSGFACNGCPVAVAARRRHSRARTATGFPSRTVLRRRISKRLLGSEPEPGHAHSHSGAG